MKQQNTDENEIVNHIKSDKRMQISSQLLSMVKGFLDDEEGLALYRYAYDAASHGPCLEIGSYCGKSAIYIGSACKARNSILFSIDHHTGSEEQQPGETYFDPELFDKLTNRVDTFGSFRLTLKRAGLENAVVPMVCQSETAARAWDTPLSLVFIDGGHSYKAAYTDYDCWARHLLPGGYLLIHDIFKNPDDGGQAPYQVYKEALSSGDFRELSMIKTLGVLHKSV